VLDLIFGIIPASSFNLKILYKNFFRISKPLVLILVFSFSYYPHDQGAQARPCGWLKDMLQPPKFNNGIYQLFAQADKNQANDINNSETTVFQQVISCSLQAQSSG
jgi:hypothetical protein